MKSLSLLLLLFIASVAAFGQESDGVYKAPGEVTPPVNKPGYSGPTGIEALDKKNGFRQFQLGTPIAQIPGLKRRNGELYAAPGESLMVGNAKLNMLLLLANKGRLSAIALGAYGKENCDKLMDALTALYGPGESTSHNTTTWRGNTVTLSYVLKSQYVASAAVYSSAREVFTCEVYFISNPIAAEEAAEKEAAAKRAASDL